MQVDIKLLENNVLALVELCKKLRQDNHALQQEISLLYTQNKELKQKVEGAKAQIDTLLARLPGA